MAAGTATLSKKLGVRAGHQVVLLGAPERLHGRLFEGELSEIGEVKVTRHLRKLSVDTVMIFVDRLVDLEARIGAISERLRPDGQVWIAWRSNRAADVDVEVLRRIGLAAGMVDTRVCAIDRVWSGMRLVISRENREALAYRIDRPQRPTLAAARRTRRTTRPPSASVSGAGSGLMTARARRRS
jgi:hypothetical protein